MTHRAENSLTMFVGAMALLALLFMLASQGGCGDITWKTAVTKSLTGTHLGAKTAYKTSRPYYQVKCQEIARKCYETAGRPCDALFECQAERKLVWGILDSIGETVAGGYTAIQLSQEKTAQQMAARAVELLIRAQRIITGIKETVSPPAAAEAPVAPAEVGGTP